MSKLTGCAKDNRTWSEEEDKIIIENYGKLTYDQMAELLGGRSNQSIQHRRRKLGLTTLKPEQASGRSWSKEESSILRENYGVLTYGEIQDLLPEYRSLGSIQQKIKRMGLQKIGSKPWEKWEDEVLLENYLNMKVKEIQNQFLPHRSEGAIHLHATKVLGIEKGNQRTHDVNMEFFSEPNVLNSYWAGFIAADGCLTMKKHLVSFGQQWDDGYLLEQFVKDTEFEGEVVYSVTGQGNRKAALYIWGVKQWVEDLGKNFSIFPRKSLTHEPPDLDGDNRRAFIRGYIDGDGGIYPQKGNNVWVLRLRGTASFLGWIKDYCDFTIPHMHSNSEPSKVREYDYERVANYTISGDRSLLILQSLLQVDTPMLSRKWQPAIDHLQNQD